MANCTVINPTVTLGHIHGAYDYAYFTYLGKAWLMPYMADVKIEPKDGYTPVIDLEDAKFRYLERSSHVILSTAGIVW
jgi:hypothetical protein